MSYSTRILMIALFCLSLISCGVDPHYKPENPVNIPDAWRATHTHVKYAKVTPACIAWWHQFNDPVLNHLIYTGLEHNNDLHVAMANVEAAQGELKRIKLNWIPSLSAALGYSSFPYLGYPGVLATIIPTYTLNIFTQIKEQQRAKYELKITQNMRDTVKLAVIAQVSASYFRLMAETEQLNLLLQVDRDLTAQVNIFQSTYQSGLTSNITHVTKESTLSIIKASEEVIKRNKVVNQNMIQYLLDENPEHFILKRHFRALDPYRAEVSLLPLTVLENRPDMIQAIHELRATNAGIGIAASHFLPTIQLSAARGDIATIPNGSTLGMPVYFNQALIGMPLITFTTLGDVAKARGLHKASYYRYLNTFRKVLREVDTDLSAHDFYQQRFDKAVHAERHRREVYQLNKALYQQGIISYAELLDEKIKWDKIRILVNQHKLDVLLVIVRLYQDLALGYGCLHQGGIHGSA